VARVLDRIWIRFGVYVAIVVVATIAILASSVMLFANAQYREFYDSLPNDVRIELDQLKAVDQDDSPRAYEIYGHYWREDLWFGEKWSLVMGLVICIPFGLGAGFWLSRIVTKPLGSIAQAAREVARGNFSVRAHIGQPHGELAELVSDFNQMTDALQSLERERRSTAAALSHELRTPLTVLRARLHAICDDVIPANPEEFARLLEQVEHLGRLVDDVHTMSLADAGRLSLHPVALDLAESARRVLAAYQSRLGESALHAMVLAPSPTVAWADPDRVRQILDNLMENALRYATGATRLEIAVRSEGDWALLTVSDNGPGLPADVMAHLFERFHRSDSSRSRGTGGSGLGLTIVKMLSVQQGGDVQIGSSAAGGASVTVRLPGVPGGQST
jgi:signal transduction histidine kinase